MIIILDPVEDILFIQFIFPKLGELILVAVEIYRLIRVRAYVDRAASLNDAKWFIRCVWGHCELLYSVLRPSGIGHFKSPTFFYFFFPL